LIQRHIPENGPDQADILTWILYQKTFTE
jgi:hypothetical protein